MISNNFHLYSSNTARFWFIFDILIMMRRVTWFICSNLLHQVQLQLFCLSILAYIAYIISIHLLQCPSPSPIAVWSHMSWNLSSRNYNRITLSKQSIHHNWLSHLIAIPVQLPNRESAVVGYYDTNTSTNSNYHCQPNLVVFKAVPGTFCIRSRNRWVCLTRIETLNCTIHIYPLYFPLPQSKRPTLNSTPRIVGCTCVANAWSSSHIIRTCVLLQVAHTPPSIDSVLTWIFLHVHKYILQHHLVPVSVPPVSLSFHQIVVST